MTQRGGRLRGIWICVCVGYGQQFEVWDDSWCCGYDVYYENILMYTCGEIEIGILSV